MAVRTAAGILKGQADGSVDATAEAEPGDGSRLSVLGGKRAAGPLLLSPTEDGIVRTEVHDGRLVETRRYATSSPSWTPAAGCSPRAMVYVVDEREVRLLTIA